MIQRKYAEICAEFDLPPSQATLLCAVRNEPRQMADLAASLGMTKNALSQLVDRVARRELVGRASSAQDRRVVMLSATPGVAGRRAGDGRGVLLHDAGGEQPRRGRDGGPHR
ncbi:MarR family winged helix-turn-helix transcriptional regulator [Micromonospora wenchangensis]|uniref:MarR family winged helix-turn-helix transcriptional regulator n=1 Tax=Micromonospora wenchangensis TaxID=1185415 RepID=UPI0037FCD9C2